jgi:hypothetical protein
MKLLVQDTMGSVLAISRTIERELNQSIREARKCEVSKAPSQPNWDLKREFVNRYKILERETLRAIAKLNGSGDVDMEDQKHSPEHLSPRHLNHSRLSFEEDLSDSEDDLDEARKFTGSVSKADLREDRD